MLKKAGVTNGLRHQLNQEKNLLSKKNNLQKILSKGSKSSNAGRSFGRITVRHKGGGVKKLFKKLVFPNKNNFSLLISIFYDARRGSFVSFCYNFITARFFNCLSTLNTFPGSFIFLHKTFPELKLGMFLSLKETPSGSIIHSVYNLDKNTYIKSAGVFGILVQKNLCSGYIKLPSGFIKKFPISSVCVLGAVSNPSKNLEVLGKAGRSRLRGIRPSVRGVAMNPVDHPHGGQTSGGICSVTPWGIPTKGKPTRKKNVKI
jgi:large subunit ribosomal protein L2